jgi:hypothetical protein
MERRMSGLSSERREDITAVGSDFARRGLVSKRDKTSCEIILVSSCCQSSKVA